MDDAVKICIPAVELTSMQLLANGYDKSSATSAELIQESASAEVAQSVREEIDNLEPLSENCCIYRVPAEVSKLRPGAYIPSKASIGPFHHGKEKLKEMEEHKRRYLVEFLKWTNRSLEDIAARVETQETKLRSCYAETIELDRQKFVKTMLIDATFLIVFLLKARFTGLRNNGDRIFGKQQLVYYLRYDLIMLDNQIPFFILMDLFSYCNMRQRTNGLSMIELTHSFFKGRCGSWITQGILEEKGFSQALHFLDFFRIAQQPEKPKPSIKVKKLVLPTTKELYDAGVKFEVQPSENKLDVEFDGEKWVLKIPCFNINRETEALLKNLQQFEEFHCYPRDKYANDYRCLLGMLIRDRKDVEILDQNGIIENWLGDNQVVATLFSSIRWRYHNDNFYFADIIEDLNDYGKNSWNKIIANLKLNYFNTPWSGISVAAAAFLLILTVIQTVCPILQVT